MRGRDVDREVPASECRGTKFIWINPVPTEFTGGEIGNYAASANVRPCRIPAYGYGDWSEGTPLPARDGEKIVLNCHGGGYVLFSAHPEDPTAGIPKALVNFNKQTISRVLSVEYRLSCSAPWPASSPFPAAILDGLSAYHYLVKVLGFSPQNIVLSGDSAGANLVLALTRHLRDNPQLDLGLPGGLLLTSPWCDLSRTHYDKPSVKTPTTSAKNDAARCDYLAGAFDSSNLLLPFAVRSVLGDMDSVDARKNVYLNPASLDLDPTLVATMFNDFPPTYIVYGDAEVLVDEIRTLCERMVSCIGDKVIQDEVPDAVHDFTAFKFWEPDYSNTHKRIARWLSALS